jgi:hypothetical protein
MAARAQRRVCGSLPSFGETRRGIRRHGDARLGAAKRVERDAKLRQQHRRLTRIALSTASDSSTCCRTRCDAQFASVSARASTATTARAAPLGQRHRPAIRIARTLVNNGGRPQHAKLIQSSWSISLLLGVVFIVKVLDRAHQIPLAVERQCRPRTSGVENRQRQILQSNADLGQAFAALESFEVFGSRESKRDSSINTVIFEQPIDDREAAVMSSPTDGVVVVDRRARLAAVV